MPKQEHVLGSEFFQSQPQPVESMSPQRPEIEVLPGATPEAADRAEEILLVHPELLFFQRSGELVRISSQPDRVIEDAQLCRPAGTVVVQSLTQYALLEAFDRLIYWNRRNAKGAYAVDCPQLVASYYLSRGVWRLPVLTGTIFAPILRSDGSVLEAGGYDEQTGLYFVRNEEWPDLEDEPSQDDARRALDTLELPFSEFPFCTPIDRAVHTAAIVTAVQRRLLRSAPLIGYDAPVQRTGKSLLAESLGIISTGLKPPATVASSEREEFRKTITASLHEGHPVINFDNIERPLGSPFLAAAITQEIYSDRILGATRKLNLSTRTLWTATGNNLRFKGDLAVRTLICRIDSGRERPEEREFKISDLDEYLREHRKELVVAVLTILRAYQVAGRPDQALKPWGGFDQWSREIRQPLVWIGLPDPVASRQQIIADDPEQENAIILLSALELTFDRDSFTVRDIIQVSAEPRNTELLDAVKQVASHKGVVDTRSLGWWCRNHKDRVIAGLCLRADGQQDRYTRWRIQRVEKP